MRKFLNKSNIFNFPIFSIFQYFQISNILKNFKFQIQFQLITFPFSILFPDGVSHRLLFDESVQIKQLDVVEQHGILLFRAGDKGKESSVYIFRLREFESDASLRCAELFNDRENDDREKEEEDDDEGVEDDDDDCDEDDADECDNFTRATAKFQPMGRSRARMRVRAPAVRSRAHIKERKLRRTRGCHLYSITRAGGSHLRMVRKSDNWLKIKIWQRDLRFGFRATLKRLLFFYLTIIILNLYCWDTIVHDCVCHETVRGCRPSTHGLSVEAQRSLDHLVLVSRHRHHRRFSTTEGIQCEWDTHVSNDDRKRRSGERVDTVLRRPSSLRIDLRFRFFEDSSHRSDA